MRQYDPSLMQDLDHWLVGTPTIEALAALLICAGKGIGVVSNSREMLEEGIKIACDQISRTANNTYKSRRNMDE